MKDAIIITLLFCLAIMSFLFWNEILIGNSIKNINWELELKNKELETQVKMLEDWKLVYDLADEVASVPWSEEYDCYDHSKALVSLLEEHNIKSSILINSERNHALVAVWFEANTGDLVPADYEFELKEVRNVSLETICHQ